MSGFILSPGHFNILLARPPMYRALLGMPLFPSPARQLTSQPLLMYVKNKQFIWFWQVIASDMLNEPATTTKLAVKPSRLSSSVLDVKPETKRGGSGWRHAVIERDQ